MGSRDKALQPATGEGEVQEPAIAEPEVVPFEVETPEALVADESTMTFMGMTLGEFIDSVRADVDLLNDRHSIELGLLRKQIGELVADKTKLSATIKDLDTDLAVAKVVAQDAKVAARGFERTPDGGVRMMIKLDVDEAGYLLSWAADAGEDPALYIERQVHDALVSVTSS